MNAGEHEASNSSVTLAEARGELERLIADPKFHATERAKKILRYIADKCFEGETDGVKAYAIAVDVLNRASSFDTNDPIVRIEVSRLRSALSNYYEVFGDQLDVTLHLPVGRYVTIFAKSLVISKSAPDQIDEVEACAEAPLSLEVEAEVETGRGRRMRTKFIAPGATAIVGIVVGLGVLYGLTQSDPISERPSVRVILSSADEKYRKEAAITENFLVAALSQFRTLDISARNELATSSGSPGAPTAGKVYNVEMKYYGDSEDRTIWWQVVDTRDGGILKSGLEKVETDGRSDAAVRSDLVAVLARRFGAIRGVINSIEMHDDHAKNALGNTCILKAEYELDAGGQVGIRRAADCLERTVALQPSNSDALATLSRVIVAAQGGVTDDALGDRALTLANRAVSLDPASDRANVALMMVQFYSGRTEAALAVGNRALTLNPNNPEVLAKLALVLYNSGYTQAAVSMAEDARKDVEAVPRDANLVLSLDAYRRGDFSEASLISEQINCSDFVVRVLRAASLGEMSSQDAIGRLAYLKALLPDYKATMRGWMEKRRFKSETISSLERGLARAALAQPVAEPVRLSRSEDLSANFIFAAPPFSRLGETDSLLAR